MDSVIKSKRQSRESLGLLSPISMTCKKKQESKKEIYKYGMTKEEYENHINKLYS